MREIIGTYHRSVAQIVGRLGVSSPGTWATGCWLFRLSPGPRARRRTRRPGRARAGRGGAESSRPPPAFLAGARRHRHRARRGRRPHRGGSCPGARGGRRDAEPGRPAASAGRAGHRGDLIEHTQADRRPLRLPRSRASRAQRLRRDRPAWQALGASAAESRFEALRASATPLVGRGEEIDLLLRRWEQAKGGEGSVVLLSGEPGIGKSRIAETILERLSGEPHTRLRLFCSPHHQDTALYPSITQLERAAGLPRDDTTRNELTSSRRCSPWRPMTSARPCPCWRVCCRFRPATAIPRSTSPRRSAERRHCGAGIAGRGAGGASTGAAGGRGRALGRSHLARTVRADRRAGVEPAAPGDRHLPPGIRTTLGRPSAGDADQSQSPAAPAPRRDDRARHRRQGLAPGDRRPDHRSDRWRAAVHRGTDQGRGRERPARGSRRSVCGDGSGDCRWRSRHRSRNRSWRGSIAWRRQATWRRSPPLSDDNSRTS